MYLDGEMPIETMKERVALVAEQYGPDMALYCYNRERLGLDEMQPLNTPKGQKWLWQEIEKVKPDAIFFDAIMCLLSGNMSEEESWEPVKGLIRQISSRRIAQVWLHHTGHDTTKGYGTKTREWEMDTVVRLSRASDDLDDNSVVIDLTKARLRTPKNYKQFAARTIRMTEDGWVSEGAASVSRSGKDDDVEIIKREFLNSYERLAEGVEPSRGLNGKVMVRKVKLSAIRDDLKDRGFLDHTNGKFTPTTKTHLHRAKTRLFKSGTLMEDKGEIWKL